MYFSGAADLSSFVFFFPKKSLPSTWAVKGSDSVSVLSPGMMLHQMGKKGRITGTVSKGEYGKFSLSPMCRAAPLAETDRVCQQTRERIEPIDRLGASQNAPDLWEEIGTPTFQLGWTHSSIPPDSRKDRLFDISIIFSNTPQKR